MRLTTLAATLLGTMTLSACVTPQAPARVDEAWKTRLDTALAAVAADPARTLASLSTLVVRDGKVVYTGQFGARWIDPAAPANNMAANADTLYRIASISKLITTLGVMKLVEEGKVDLDADVSDYLGWTLRNPHFPNDKITLRMLLNHTSSLRDDGGYYWPVPANIRDALTPGGKLYGKGLMWANPATHPAGLRLKPGQFFQYANLPWGVVGTVMESAAGERFDRLMQRLILDPMDMPGGFHPPDFPADVLDNTATLYRKRSEINGKEVWNSNGPWVPQVDDYSQTPPASRAGPGYVIGSNGTAFGPQGNIRLSAVSLGKVMLMLMHGGMHEGRNGSKRILSQQSVDTMLAGSWQRNRNVTNGNPDGELGFGKHQDYFNAWGLGNQHFLDISGPGRGDRLVKSGGFTAVGHLGDAWGLTSGLVFNRETRNGMVYLIGGPSFDPDTNPGEYSALYRHEERILDALYQRAVQRRLD